MSGSLRHLARHNSTGDKILGGWSSIRSRQDTAECVEQLLWLVIDEVGLSRAEELIRNHFYPMEDGELPQTASYKLVKRQMGQ